MITIISCFWNPGDYIERCITSIKNQNYKNFRVFLIDDMSTDNTIKIIEELIKDDNRFTLIKNSEKKFKLKNLDYGKAGIFREGL